MGFLGVFAGVVLSAIIPVSVRKDDFVPLHDSFGTIGPLTTVRYDIQAAPSDV